MGDEKRKWSVDDYGPRQDFTRDSPEWRDAVSRFAREPDWRDSHCDDYTELERAYREGYIAARRELRALLGIEEG